MSFVANGNKWELVLTSNGKYETHVSSLNGLGGTNVVLDEQAFYTNYKWYTGKQW